MNVGDLRKFIHELPDETPVFVNGYEDGLTPDVKTLRVAWVFRNPIYRPYSGAWEEGRTLLPVPHAMALLIEREGT